MPKPNGYTGLTQRIRHTQHSSSDSQQRRWLTESSRRVWQSTTASTWANTTVQSSASHNALNAAIAQCHILQICARTRVHRSVPIATSPMPCGAMNVLYASKQRQRQGYCGMQLPSITATRHRELTLMLSRNKTGSRLGLAGGSPSLKERHRREQVLNDHQRCRLVTFAPRA